MFFNHLLGLFTHPKEEWGSIHKKDYSVAGCLLTHTMIFALIPAVSGFIGTTQIGWRIGAGPAVKLTVASAVPIAVLYYLAMIVGVFTIAWAIRWMSETYDAHQPLAECMVLASYTATPLFLIGIMQLYPLLWLNFLVGLPALGYTAYIFYTGVPIMMEISEERGFLFASAALAFGMVVLVGMLAVTALLWGSGLAPMFTR